MSKPTDYLYKVIGYAENSVSVAYLKENQFLSDLINRIVKAFTTEDVQDIVITRVKRRPIQEGVT